MKKRKLIVQMMDKDGQCQTDRKAIADIFGDFYEQLYSFAEQPRSDITGEVSSLPPFTMNELVQAVKGLKRNTCADEAGIRAEMLKEGGRHLLENYWCSSKTKNEDQEDNIDIQENFINENDEEIDQTDQMFEFVTIPSFVSLFELLYFVELTDKGIAKDEMSDPFGHFIA